MTASIMMMSDAYSKKKLESCLVGYVFRTFDVFCHQKRSGTPLERLRDSREGQKPSSFPLGIIGFSKPAVLSIMEGSEIGGALT